MENNLIQSLEEKAKQKPQKIAFPETGNEMILKAAEEVVKRKIGYPVMVGNQDVIEAFAKEHQVSTEGFSYYDNTSEEAREKLAKEYIAKFDDFSEKAVMRKAKDSVNFAMFLLKLKKADGVAAGREYTTADVIISAQTIVGLKEGFNSISSLGILNVPGFEGPEGQMLAIADCAVNAQPDSDDLADIAISSADTVKTLLGWEPRVAMLSFSTCGSSEHESIDVIRKGIEIVKIRRPDLKIDGEFQLDSAINPKTAANKVKRESDVAGIANVLIFPNLHAGNIGVKLIQTFGKADAYGPVLQGFALPVCDFSRSAPLSEMMGNIIMLIIRAQEDGGN
ncbi:phosphate acyltransferase [Konateibacter massiliensis]|uniref:phosphate acyltransferase n=1 Tax=Konateibacter massiliensis TaxID=2002841 RepID=UPI000C1486F8|nr:phosphate acyltransferase [Konateibacter massiliensis]